MGKSAAIASASDDSVEPLLDSAYQSSRRKSCAAFYGVTESHQYEVDESEVWRHHQLQRHFEDKGHWWTFAKKREVRRWVLTLITGLLFSGVLIFGFLVYYA